MKTKRQEELVHSFLSELDDVSRPIYQGIIARLSELGYHPQKQRSYIVFKHDRHNKQMAKIGIDPKDKAPFFALRFSACRGYSQRFEDVVRVAVEKDNFREALCLKSGCDFCRGEAASHVYTYKFPDGESRSHCGAVALEIPDLTADDVAEIKKLLAEEHDYLIAHEAGNA
jgi:hypothetical protein